MAWSPYLPWVEYLFKDERMVDASVIHLKLSASLMVHPTFHISYVKPVAESELSPMVDYWNIDGIHSPADPGRLPAGPWLARSGRVGGLRSGVAVVGPLPTHPRHGTAPVCLSGPPRQAY